MIQQDPFGLYQQAKGKEMAFDQPSDLSMTFVSPDKSKGAVVLERIEDGTEPVYCVHGRTRCFSCLKWCYLGVETHAAVTRGVVPLCMQCASKYCKPDQLIGNLDDKGHSHR